MQRKKMYSNAINKHISDKLSMQNAKWNWSSLSSNENITWEIVKENIDKPWDWCVLSYNKNITWEIVNENIDMLLNWYWLSKNENVLLSLEKMRMYCYLWTRK